jgi:replication factor A1
MHKTKNELYNLIRDIKSKEEFENDIKKRFEEFEKLLDEETIALLIVDELGRNKKVISKIADIKPNFEYTVVGQVKNVYESRKFKRKNGKPGKVINLDISDETGSCRLVLWNNDVEIVKNKDIVKGSIIKIINGYTKEGYSGVEINLGRWGLLELESSDQIQTIFDTQANTNEISGELTHKNPTKVFFKDTGDVGFVTTIKINGENEEKNITLWDEKVKEIQKFKIGNKILIKDVTIKQNNGIKEIHANSNSEIKKV